MSNDEDTKKRSDYKDLQLLAHLLRPDAHEENPQARAALNKLNRRQTISMALAFVFGGASFWAAKEGSEKGSEAYQKKLDEMGGYDGASKACDTHATTSPEWAACFRESLRPAWDEHHKTARSHLILAASLASASLISFGTLYAFLRKSNKIQDEVDEAIARGVKENLGKIKASAPDFFSNMTPKGPTQ